MPDARDISDEDAAEILAAKKAVRDAQERLEKAVARGLINGASIRAVVALGFSQNTVAKYGRAHGWPTEANRAGFNATRWDRARAEREKDQQ